MSIEKYIEAVQAQARNALRPTYHSNETLGGFTISIYNVDECEKLFAYMDAYLILIDGWYYDVFTGVIGRLSITDSYTSDNRPYASLDGQRIHKGKRVMDEIGVKYWITSKDGANNSTKPDLLVKLEGRDDVTTL